MVPIDTNGQMDIQKAVAPMPSIGTPPDFYNQSELIQQDMDRVSGTSDYMRGATANIRRTATEAAMIQDAMNSRAADKLSRIESTLSEVGARLIQLMQLYMVGEKVVRVVGARVGGKHYAGVIRDDVVRRRKIETKVGRRRRRELIDE